MCALPISPRTQSQSPKVGATISHHDCCGGADGQVVRVQATCPVLQTSAQRDGYRYIPAWRRLLRPRTATTSNIDYCRVRRWRHRFGTPIPRRSEEHTSELQSLMRISYAVFCLKKNNHNTDNIHHTMTHIYTA